MNPDISYEVTLWHDTAGKIRNAVTQKSTNCELRNEGQAVVMSSERILLELIFWIFNSISLEAPWNSKNPSGESGSCPKVDLA